MLTLFKAFCRIMLEGMTFAVRRLRARAAHSANVTSNGPVRSAIVVEATS